MRLWHWRKISECKLYNESNHFHDEINHSYHHKKVPSYELMGWCFIPCSYRFQSFVTCIPGRHFKTKVFEFKHDLHFLSTNTFYFCIFQKNSAIFRIPNPGEEIGSFVDVICVIWKMNGFSALTEKLFPHYTLPVGIQTLALVPGSRGLLHYQNLKILESSETSAINSHRGNLWKNHFEQQLSEHRLQALELVATDQNLLD